MHDQGLHHHDIRPANVLIKDNGSICLVDLHQAVERCDMGDECPDRPFFQVCPFSL
jgi:serine/threonine protein kinase